jgi:cullin-4
MQHRSVFMSKIAIRQFGLVRSTPTAAIEILQSRVVTAVERLFQAANAGINADAASIVSGVDCSEIFLAVEELCSVGRAQTLSESIMAVLLEKASAAAALFSEATDVVEVCILVCRMWASWRTAADAASQLLTWLDRSYTVPTQHTTSARAALHYLCKAVIRSDGVYDRAQRGFFEILDAERRGDGAGRIAECASMREWVVACGVHDSRFLPAYLASGSAYFTSFANHVVAELPSCDEFTNTIGQWIGAESARASKWLLPSAKTDAAAMVQRALVAPAVNALLHHLLSDGIARRDLKALHRIYKLCTLRFIQVHDHLRRVFRRVVTERVAAIMGSHKGSSEAALVPKLLECKRLFDEIVRECFDQNEAIRLLLRESFEHAMRGRQNRVTELLVRYMDASLAKPEAGSAQAENNLPDALAFVALLTNPDVFEACYSRELAKRLLTQRCMSMEGERAAIDVLKRICGPSTGLRLSGMIADTAVSERLRAGFSSEGTTFIFTPYVVTQAYWPSQPPVSLATPPAFAELAEKFASHYTGQHSTRHLTWQPLLSYCSIVGRFPSGVKSLLVSQIQALVLLLFNDTDSLSFGAIKDGLRMTDGLPELALALLSLSGAATRVLTRQRLGMFSPATGLPAEEVFTFNASFTHIQSDIRVAPILLKDANDEAAVIAEKTAKDRPLVLDAAIVRIMKARQTLLHSELAEQVSRAVKLIVTPADLKKRVELLLEREYLKRDDKDFSRYHYVS